MRLDELAKEAATSEPDDDEFEDDENEVVEDLTNALDYLQRGLVLMSQIVIKPSTGRIRFAPDDLPEYVEELQEFLGQWDDYGKNAIPESEL